MNLLQTQDSLKNMSDQQLMLEMQNPTGQVPQFLVLSELKRRKDMRGQNQSPPSTTVADELTQPSQAAVTQPGTTPAQVMPQGAGTHPLGGQGMREGGPVRMAEGGRPPSGLEGLTDQQLRDILSPQESVPAAPTDNAFSRFLRGGRRENLPEQQWIPIAPNTQSTIFGQPPRAAIEQVLRNRMAAPGENPDPLAVPSMAAPQQGSQPLVHDGYDSAEVTPPRLGIEQIASRPGVMQAPAVASPITGRPAAPMASTPTGQAGASQSNLPPPVTIDRSAMNAIAQRMDRERVDPNRAREEARNMALLQAGLAIAGGTSPHFAQNLAGAIPAIQGYQTQTANIRKEGRDELKAQFDLAKADVEAQYHQGMITEHQRSAEISRLNAQLQAATTLEGHRISANAHIAAAGIGATSRERNSDLERMAESIQRDNPAMPHSAAMERAAGVLRGVPGRDAAREDNMRQEAVKFATNIVNRTDIDRALRASGQEVNDTNRVEYVYRLMRGSSNTSSLVPGENGIQRYVGRT